MTASSGRSVGRRMPSPRQLPLSGHWLPSDGRPAQSCACAVAVHTGEAQIRDHSYYLGPTLQPLRPHPLHGARRSGAGLSGDRDACHRRSPGRGCTRRSRSPSAEGSRAARAHLAAGPSGPAVVVPGAALAGRLPPQPAGPGTPLIGRGAEIVDLGRLLDTERLVTLTGSAGVGKTRLALAVAAEELDSQPGGVWWVELAPIADPGAIGRAALTAIGSHETPGALAAAAASQSSSAISRRCSRWTTANTSSPAAPILSLRSWPPTRRPRC